MENRILNMRLTRKGYCPHPERDIVLLEEELFLSGNYTEEINALSMRYIEADFIVFATDESYDYSNEMNLYGLFDLTDEEREYLEGMAKITCRNEIEPNDFVETVQAALVKEGYTREGSTLLTINDDDTTRKINLDCTPNM